MGKATPRVWITITIISLLICIVIQLLTIISPNWFEGTCQNKTLLVGLWQYCGGAINTSQTNISTGHAGPPVIDIDLFGYKQETETCMSIGSYIFTDGGRKPVWFYANRVLQCSALAAAVVETILFIIFSLSARALATDLLRGFVILSLTVGGFILVGLFCIAGKNDNVWEILAEEHRCYNTSTTDGGTAESGSCVYLAMFSAACAFIAATVLVVVWLIDRPKGGDNVVKATDTKAKHYKENLKFAESNNLSENKSKRLRATCSYKPNIKFIATERYLSFSNTGELDIAKMYSSASDSELDEISVTNLDNNNIQNSEDLFAALDIDDNTVSTHF